MNTYFPYFHVSDVPLQGICINGSVTLHPRVPQRMAPYEDARTPRICCAPKIANCLRMVAWTDYTDVFHVYALLTNPVQAGLDIESPLSFVPDINKTERHQEVWLTKKARFAYLGSVTMSRIDLITGRPCYWWSSFGGYELPNEPDCMTDEQRRRFLENEAYHAQVAAEMQAELEAKGGKLLGDALMELPQMTGQEVEARMRDMATPKRLTFDLSATKCELHNDQNCPSTSCLEDPSQAKPTCWHCGESGAEDCGKHSETELRHAALEGD